MNGNIKTSNDYLTNRAWLSDMAKGEDVVLRGTSALEYHQLFIGYCKEKDIYVYAKEKGKNKYFQYSVINNFDEIETVQIKDVRCTTVSQTVNDMLSDYDNTDEQALLESLSSYYFSNNMTFDGLVIKDENMELFNSIKDWAIDYHCEG